MAESAWKNNLDWFISFRHPKEIWGVHPSFLVCEILFYITCALTLSHALRLGGRYFFLWLSIFFHGFTVELLSYFVPDIDNFWHAQSTVVLLGKRLPLHIICLYPVFLYTATIAAYRLRLSRWATAFAAGIGAVLIDLPFDIIGVKHLWWTWHDTDPNIAERHYWVPWTSYYFHASFAVGLHFVLNTSRKWITGNSNQDASCSGMKFKELICSIFTGLLSTPVGIILFIPIYHPLHDILGISTEVCVILYLSVYVFILWSADRNPNIDSRTGKFVMDEISLVVLIHFLTIFLVMALSKPENIISSGIHEEIGPCGLTQDVRTPLGMVLSKRKYLCLSDYSEDFDFHCQEKGFSMLKDGDKFYTICGTSYPNFHEYIVVVGSLCVGGFWFYMNSLLKSGVDLIQSPFKIKKF